MVGCVAKVAPEATVEEAEVVRANLLAAPVEMVMPPEAAEVKVPLPNFKV